jgi:lipopolysaccharide biosynthesis glycosyltransferase
MWLLFNQFNVNQSLGLAPEAVQHDGWYGSFGAAVKHVGKGYNAGVLMLDLKKLRQGNFYETMHNIIDNQALVQRKISYISLGDQDYLNEYIFLYTGHLFPLSCVYNYRNDFCDSGGCDAANTTGIVILHGNRSLFHKTGIYKQIYDFIYNMDWNINHHHYIKQIKNFLTGNNVLNGNICPVNRFYANIEHLLSL